MAKISTYKKDGNLRPLDRILGSSYEGLANGVPVFTTSSYTLGEISRFLTGYIYPEEDAFDGWALQTKIEDAFLSDASGNIVDFKEALKTAQEEFVLGLDISTNAVIEGLAGSISTANTNIGEIIEDVTGVNNTVSKISDAFTFDGDGYPTGFGNTIEENIYGLAQLAVDLTPFALNDDLLEEAGLLDKVRAAFTFDENGNVDNFNTTLATASADQTRAIFVADGLAYGADVDKIKTAVGTFDENDNLIALSEGLSQKISTVISTDTATLALQIDGVQAAFGTFDPETGELTSFSEALNNHVSSVVAGDGYAASGDLTTLETFVKGEDGTGGLVGSISVVSDAAGTANTTAEAAAFKTASLGSVFGEFDTNGNFTPSSTASYFESIKTYVNVDSAVAEKANNLTTAVGNIPRIYRQDEPPSLTETPIGSLWFDTANSNKGYILVAGTPNVWTIVEDEEFTQFKSDYEEVINTTANESSATATKTNRLNSVLEILDENGELAVANQAEYFGSISTYVDQNSATAEKAENLRITVGDAESGLVAQANDVTTLAGNLQGHLEATRTINVDANGNIASMQLYADEETSEIVFRADTFKIFNTTSNVAPFTLDGTALKLNVPLNGVSGTFSGEFAAGGVSIDGSSIVLSAHLDSGSWVGAPNISFYTGPTPTDGLLFGGNIETYRDADKLDPSAPGWGGLRINSDYMVVLAAPEVLVSGLLILEEGIDSPDITLDKVTTYGNTTSNSISVGGIDSIGNISVTGAITATGNITAYFSDDRLKTRIKNIENPIDKIKSLNGFEFELNETSRNLGVKDEGVQIGVSAQEVQKVLPQIVKQSPINENYLTVQYEKLVALLIEGMKEQQTQIEELKNRLDGLTK